MQHLRVFVKVAANAVAAVLAHHAQAMAFGKGLDGVANVAQVSAFAYLHDAFPHGFIGQVAQPFGRYRHVAHHVHAAGIAVPAVFDDGDVHIDDVAFLQWLVVGNAVAHLMVDRRADRLGVGVVATGGVVQRGRNGTQHAGGVVLGQAVELVGGQAGLDQRGQVVEQFGSQSACHAHADNTVGVFDGDSHRKRLSHWASVPEAGVAECRGGCAGLMRTRRENSQASRLHHLESHPL